MPNPPTTDGRHPADLSSRPRRRLRRIPALVLLAALGAAAACTPPTPRPATPVFAASAGIESTGHEGAPKPCDPANSYDKPGPQALRTLLNATYGTIAAGITRKCDGSTSEHHEGRALDWMVDYRDTAARAKALAVLDWMRATDTAGNPAAVARRMGIQYMIYNKQMYGSWNGFNPTPYACGAGTDPTACHVDHIHFSFTWAGAYKQVSFWRGSALPTVPSTGTSFVVDARSSAPVLAPAQLGSGRTYVVEASGTYRYGPLGVQLADAACSSPGTWVPIRTAAPYGNAALDLKVGGGGSVGGSAWTPVTDTGGGCNTLDHRYRMTVRSWSALPITAVVLDGGRTDNAGSLRITIRPAS